jgi:hypothetical protein
MLLESSAFTGLASTAGTNATNFAASGYPPVANKGGGEQWAPVATMEGTRKMKSKEKSGSKELVKPPPQKGPIFLYYADIGQEDLVRVANAKTKAEVRRMLQECLKIDEEEGFHTEILCDFHYHNYAFCVERGFTIDKISTFLSIMKHTLAEAVEKKLFASDAFDVFKRWLLKHSVERPPWSVGIFTHDDVKEITSYVHNTFIRHYQLYMYVYMVHCDIDVQAEYRSEGGFAQTRPLQPLYAACEVGSKEADEMFMDTLRDLKVISKPELCPQPELQRHAEDEAVQGDRAAIIKRKVEEGVKELLAKFEDKLQEQDEMFRTMADG